MLNSAQKSIYVAVFSLGDKRIVDKWIELKAGRHLDVRVLLNLSQTQGRSSESSLSDLIDSLRQAGIEVVIGSSEQIKPVDA